MTTKRKAVPLPKVILDIGPMFDDQWTGIPVFTRRLAQALLRCDQVQVEFCSHLTQIPAEAVRAAIRSGTGTYLRAYCDRHAGDSGHNTIDPSARLLYPTVKSGFGVAAYEASTVHDLSTLYMPENHDDANVVYHLENFSRELHTDGTVFCVSEATRAAVDLAFPSARGKTRVLYQYVDWPDHFQLMNINLPQPKIEPYALVIGTLEPRKNLGLLISALKTTELRKSRLKFVVIGRKGWKIEQVLVGLTPKDRQRIIFSGFVSEFMKYRLMQHAQFLVYPSIYEGFGIPALEALSLGKPVLSAMTSSFPEVVGDAGVYFDPMSVDSFAAAFEEISHPGKLSELGGRTHARAAQFDCHRMAEPVIAWAHDQ